MQEDDRSGCGDKRFFFGIGIQDEHCTPLQRVIAPRHRPLHEWIARFLWWNFFQLDEDKTDEDVETYVSGSMGLNQQIYELMKMPGSGGYFQIMCMESSFRMMVAETWVKDQKLKAKQQSEADVLRGLSGK